MLLQPKETKFTKKRKGRIKSNYENKKNDLKFGTYGLYALEKGKITAAQIEAVRRTITNYTKRQVKIWIRIFPDIPVTSKPIEIRMGRGKGKLSYWACKINKGKILFEVSGKNPKLIKLALNSVKGKLPIKVKLITKNEFIE